MSIKTHLFFMDSSRLSFFLFFSLLLLFNIPHSHSSNSKIRLKCHENEKNALLEFKDTFYDQSCIPNPYFGTYLKTWIREGKNGDCCSWDGIECDEYSGHVISLDLYSSCLSGSINSNSSIFKLSHLQRLDLSVNNFGYSKIPSALRNLSRLENLYLIDANFSGQIPSEILYLTNLSSLDLSFNQLTLKNPSLRDLGQSLVKLEELGLDLVDMSSSISDSISRLTSLRSLSLIDCKLQGQIPPSIANLTKLKNLKIVGNNLEGEIPSLQKLTNLEILILNANNLVGNAISSFSNLTELHSIDLFNNHFIGEVFPQLLRLTKLEYVDLSSNKFSGQIPKTISHLKNLIFLLLDSNDFSGKPQLDGFFQLENLERLYLSYNRFSFIMDSTIKPRSKLQHLGLASCNLRSIPLLLQSQDRLENLDLSSNNISGEVPQWFLDVSIENISFLNISHNHLAGSVPIPSTNSSLQYYFVSNNEFSGELPMRVCNLVNLEIFDVSNNNLSGMIPQCLASLVGMGNLFVLNLHSNSFNGPIPHVGKHKCNVVMIDISYNKLEGPMPRDMKNCPNLEFLNLGNNKINDVFPFWLGKLPSLSILILCSNRFYGTIGRPLGGYEFLKLQIIDISNNNFTGYLLAQYFEGWIAMKVDAHKEDRIMSYASYSNTSYPYFYAVTMANKGMSVEYNKIPKSLVGIDLSSNYFTGEIPQPIATLKGLRFLNLSNNILIGSIPFNLMGLTNLESLDLSHNKLSGEIPQQLTDLTALSSFDVSFNQLTGPIPQSKQFNTFENSSYQGNPNLCGFPLSKKCGNIIATSSPPLLEKDRASRTSIEIDWKIVSMGYTSGFVIGVVMGMNWKRGYKRVKRIRQIKFVLN